MGVAYLKIYLSIFFMLFFGLILPMVLMGGVVKIDMILFYLLTFYSTIRLALIIRSKRIRIMEITFFIFVYIFFGIAALAQVKLNIFPWGGVYSSESVLNGGLIVVSGIVAYELGVFFNKAKNIGESTLKSYRIDLPFVTIVGLTAFFIGVMGKGGFQSLFLPRNELSALSQSLGVDSTVGLILTVFVRIPLFVALLFALLIYIDKEKKNVLLKSNALLLLLICFLGVLTLVGNNPISSARYWVGTIYIALMFTVLKWNRLTQPFLLMTITIILLLVFPFADIFRNSLDADLNIRPLTEIMAGKGDYDSFQQVMNIVDYTSYYGVAYGMQFLGVIFFWVPRSIWPDKPIGSGATVAEAAGYNFTNVSAPLWSEFYINFGIIGLLVLFFLYGRFTAILQIKYEISRLNKYVNFYRVFVPVFAAYQLFMLRGDLLSSFANIAPIVIFIAIGFRYKRFKKVVFTKRFRIAKD